MSEPSSSSAPPLAPDQAPGASTSTPGGATVEVTCKTLDDREAKVKVYNNQRVQTIVDNARSALGIQPATNMKVIFGGRVLDSKSTVQNAGIKNGNTVHLVERGHSVHNERPNVARPVPPNPMMIQRLLQNYEGITPGVPHTNQPSYTMVPPIRVPPAVGGVPVIMARYADDVITQRTYPMRTRPGRTQNIDTQTAPTHFLPEPNFISWTVRIADNQTFTLPREVCREIIKEVIRDCLYIPENYRAAIVDTWDPSMNSVSIAIPELPPHIPSPALEKLDFLALWTENITKVIDKLVEQDGLVDAVRRVLEMVQNRETFENLTEPGVNQRFTALDNIIRDLEMMWAELSHQKDFERERFSKPQNRNRVYQSAKIEEHLRTPRNPRFFMRHALDIDFLEVNRAFRQQRLRFAALEDLLDDITEAGALKFIRDTMTHQIDYRYRALSMYYCYMQRMRHQIGHMTHICADFDISLMVPSNPQRLLPNHATNVLQVPYPHAGTLIFRFVAIPDDDQMFDAPITHVIEPPRLLSDITKRDEGDYPYLPYHPPSVHMESVLQPARRIVTPMEPARRPAGLAFLQGPFPVGNFPPQLGPYAGQNPVTGQFDWFAPPPNDPASNLMAYYAQLAEDPNADDPRVRAARMRRFVTTTNGDVPSVPIETQPPPAFPPNEQHEAPPPARRWTNYRFNVPETGRGPATATLNELPMLIEPTELQRIAKNIAARYRGEALMRIATNLTNRFNDESWDTRIKNMPLCTLRDCIALALELLTSSGNSVAESRELMLALVRDEDVLVRAISECVKSLFGRGEFPTHVARLIMPRSEAASSRNDYESVDHVDDAQSDEFDGMIVRVPSDISQPQSGDLRAIRERRQSRRQFLENRGRIPSTSSAPSTSSSSAPPGPSFNEQDQAEIRAGRLPLGNRPPNRRPDRNPTPNARPESPSQHIVITSTAPHPFQALLSQHLVMPGPSTSQVVPPPWEAPIMPIRQVVSPTPTTRALHDFDISDTSEHNAPSTATPSPPAPTPRSAPATVTSSPTPDNGMDTDSGSSGDPRDPREAARLARARIDHLAATFNGNLADSRRQSPFPNGPTAPLDDPRRNATRPTQFAIKPLVAIDPFMHCTNRHCEINRLSHPSQLADMERYTLQSIRPDDEFAIHLQRFLPLGDRRPRQVSQHDVDYNYDVKRNTNGEIAFENLEIFRKFVQTMIRSLLANCVDADSLHTMNMNPISGYPAANHAELVRTVKDHLNSAADRRGLVHPPRPVERNPATDQNRERVESWTRNARADMEFVAQQAARLREQIDQQAQRGPPEEGESGESTPEFPDYPPGIDMEQDVLIPGRIASLLVGVSDYMDVPENPRPSGLFMFLLDVLHGRLTRHDFAQLARRPTAINVLSEYQASIRAYIREHYMDNRRNHSTKELHDLAIKHSNTEDFYQRFMTRNRRYKPRLQFGSDGARVTWIFRQCEITFLKAMFTLSQLELDTSVVVQQVLQCVDHYLYRVLWVFYELEGKNLRRFKQNCNNISEFFCQVRFRGAANHNGWQEFMGEFNHVLDYWIDKYENIPEADVINFLLNVGSGQWNDGAQRDPSQPTAFSSDAAPGPSTSSRPRKRNHAGTPQAAEDDVDMVAPLMTSLSTSSPPEAPKDIPGSSSSN
ncbi:hypothetical protein CAEBREN_10592 [Caenorhabditis brenneri]|uniref:Ubiquitin-like domain-containing protein n=1 Tax=Caenorhabditis brenneri TaxID=135651 RepID=G0MGF9_CAEBE|nr:hypothetical protein CAEBREN_10592 [Caenorhabditis brenneri]